jgi:threonylcarbamoyladenosine tRNA methylthiotransferase MtaB
LAELVTRVHELQTGGACEVVLTGVHIGDYEDHVGTRQMLLHDLVAAILEKTTLPRIRLSSLEPVELTAELIALFENERLCPHFHMSIQSANTRILSAMRRKYDAKAVETSLELIARKVPNAFVGMDVIAGFPGETEEEFLDTYERLSRLPWTRLHVFPYSERPGTKAATYEGRLPRDVKALRAQRLRDLSSARFSALALNQVGTHKKVLVLKNQGQGAGFIETLSRDYWPVRLSEGPQGLLPGSEISVQIRAFDQSEASRMDGVLLGRYVQLHPNNIESWSETQSSRRIGKDDANLNNGVVSER